jgi:anti-anti-sigma regulatory factor
MNQKFHYSLKKKENIQYVSIMGVIDEDNNLQELGERIGEGTLILNLGNIERINSCGVRDWVNWLASIEKKGTKVIIVEASPAIVAQINLVNNFAGNAVIKSFFAPYYCNSCDKEKVLLIEANPWRTSTRPKRPRADATSATASWNSTTWRKAILPS